MKKPLLFLFVIATMLSGCDTDEAILSVQEQNQTSAISTSKFRTIDAARAIAQQILDMSDSRGRNNRTLKDNSGVTILRTKDSRSTQSDTLMYALDIEDNHGFVLIAAPLTMSPLIAVVDEGSYSDPENLENKSYQFALSTTMHIISQEINKPRLPLEPIPIFYIVIDSVNYKYNPTVNVNWNQDWPANLYVENNVAGCVPLATVAAMSAIEYPKTISYTFPGSDISSENIDWSSIKKHKSGDIGYKPTHSLIEKHYNDCEAPQSTHYTIGRLVRQMGYVCGAFNNNGATAVYRNRVFDAVKKYLPSDMYKEFDPALNLYNDAITHKVIILDYYHSTSDGYSGHTWIADGVWRFGMMKHYYELVGSGPNKPNPGDITDKDEYVWVKAEGTMEELLHFNWGWGGNCNGWFRWLKTFDPSKPYQYDDPFCLINSAEYKYLGHYIAIGTR